MPDFFGLLTEVWLYPLGFDSFELREISKLDINKRHERFFDFSAALHYTKLWVQFYLCNRCVGKFDSLWKSWLIMSEGKEMTFRNIEVVKTSLMINWKLLWSYGQSKSRIFEPFIDIWYIMDASIHGRRTPRDFFYIWNQ